MLVGGCDQTPWTFILLVAALRFLSCDSELTPGYSIKAPKEVTAQLGLCVHIPCTFTVAENDRLSPNTLGLWHKDHSFSGNLLASKTDSGGNTQERAILTGDVSKGDCSVSILDVQWSDESLYHFRIEDWWIKFSFWDVRPSVTVTGVTDKPVISPINSVVAGEEVTLTCTSLGRCSESQQMIKWQTHGKEHLKNVSILRDTVANENGSTTYYSNLTFIPSLVNQGLSISCVMIYVYSKNEISSNLTLSVEYPPIVNITTTDNPQVDDDEHLSCTFNESLVECTCVIQSVPFAAFKWVVDPKEYFGNSSNSILSIAMKQLQNLHSSRQKCTSFIENNYLDTYRIRSTDCGCNIDIVLILGFVVGNIIILSLIGVGLFCYIKRSRKNTSNGTRSNEVEMRTEGTESHYQDLKHQTHSIYHTLKK